MAVIARDAVASDHLVYAWPFPLGPEVEVSCADDEQVVMCPAWLVGDRLGPGHHLWRTPDPSRPVSAFFVLTAPVEVSFDLLTMFLIPSTGQPIRLRASGSLQVRCIDPGLLIAQFVGLPFDRVNDGVLRSVSRSVERMLARLLTRRVVMAGSPLAVTDTGQLASIVEELVAYNPTAGAVFGIELIRMGHLSIVADDGSSPYIPLPSEGDWSNGHADGSQDVPLLETARGRPSSGHDAARVIEQSSPQIVPLPAVPPVPPGPKSGPITAVAGEIRARPASHHDEPPALPPPPGRHAIEMPQSTDDITQPGVHTPVPGAMRIAGTPMPHLAAKRPDSGSSEVRGAIVGIGMSAIGHSVVSGEIPTKVAPGARVLVPGPNGLMQSATVRQLLQGYYELEVGSSGETIWVPIGGVVPEN
jgi:hypothetical protein